MPPEMTTRSESRPSSDDTRHEERRDVPAPAGGRRGRAGLNALRGVAKALAALWLSALLLVIWWFWSADSTSTYFPPLQTILERLYDLWVTGDAKGELVSSLQHFAVGYASAAIVGIGAGAVLWRVGILDRSVTPLLYFLYVLPAPALLPAMMTIFGIGFSMKAAIIGFAAVWPTLFNTVDGMRGVEPVKLDTAQALGLTTGRTLRSVVLPAALPQIVAGLRNSLQVAIILMVVSEMAASTSGIGYFILVAQQSFAITDMWTGIIVLALVGSVLNLLFVAVERRVLAWHYGSRAVEEKG